jgi:hypothetical protein
MATVVTTAEAKTHLRIYHSLDDSYIATLCTVAQEEWEAVTKMLLDSATTQQSIRYEQQPADGLLRFHYWPVDFVTGSGVEPTFASDDPALAAYSFSGNELVSNDLFQAVDAHDAIDNGNISFPGTLNYYTLYDFSQLQSGVAVPDSIKHCLLMRIGSLYSYRGDDVQPPNLDQWKMLAARWRKGGLL